MVGLYPSIEPYDRGMLNVGDGNHLYWEVCGRPDGKPAVVLCGSISGRAEMLGYGAGYLGWPSALMALVAAGPVLL
jgi:hypothetical protein